MKKSIAVLATIMFLGVMAADTVLLQPTSVYAAVQTSGDQDQQPGDNAKDGKQGGKADGDHSSHH